MKDGYKIFDSDTHVGPYVDVLEKYLSAPEMARLSDWDEYKARSRHGYITYTRGQRRYQRKLGTAEATKEPAGYMAGFEVLDIVNEPTAATLAYAWMKGELGRVDGNKFEKTIMVYDLGGGTFDVTVVRYSATHFRVLATDGDVFLGGLDWTNRIVEHVAEQFLRKYGSDPPADSETRQIGRAHV